MVNRRDVLALVNRAIGMMDKKPNKALGKLEAAERRFINIVSCNSVKTSKHTLFKFNG